MDGAEDCLVFNSGAAAIFAGVFANVKAGDHIVSVKAPYTWAQRMFDVVLPRFGVTTTYIDGTKMENWEHATQPNTTFILSRIAQQLGFCIAGYQGSGCIGKIKKHHYVDRQ